MDTRIKGQDVSLRLSVDGVQQRELTALKSFNLQLELKVVQEGYLGETSMRHDDAFDGVSGALAFALESAEPMVLGDVVVQRARRAPDFVGTRINAAGRFNFPGGDKPRVLIQDLKFDPMNFDFPARDQYGSVNMSYKADNARFITT